MFTRMPFGLANAPATFSRLDQVFNDIRFKSVLTYIHDFSVYSISFEEHINHLRGLFSRLELAGLKIKPSKCVFATDNIQFLGHEVTCDGTGLNTSKVIAITKSQNQMA